MPEGTKRSRTKVSDFPYNSGTVSKILWHFTGGPLWDNAKAKQGTTPRPAEQAFENLCSIVKSKELRIGGFREVIKVRVPKITVFNKITKKAETKTNQMVTLESSPVCCLADIPIAHLGYHSVRYGKFAIGFHRQAAIRHGFNPVLYTLHDTAVLRTLYEGIGALESIDTSDIVSAAENLEPTVNCDRDTCEADVEVYTDEIEAEASALDEVASDAKDRINGFLAFIKTFDLDEFQTIYCEREWRSVESFKFNADDLAMIVVPRKLGGKDFYEPFLRKIDRLRVPKTIPVVPWEDLIEH